MGQEDLELEVEDVAAGADSSGVDGGEDLVEDVVGLDATRGALGEEDLDTEVDDGRRTVVASMLVYGGKNAYKCRCGFLWELTPRSANRRGYHLIRVLIASWAWALVTWSSEHTGWVAGTKAAPPSTSSGVLSLPPLPGLCKPTFLAC